ncbi:protein-disulfide isomerase [Nonomuraea muscovyensis]|uniref:Protein-disulfide isomerase n=1 Tax=Nonomuraea muscovyensis TaxID=1124761 RepID=A0A7X0BZT9_9ACTN|nr:thioredoxin domain-containing protein [Nonomuraea muscovyensis]MBB6345882.1 protein-disulfide isomerase [Nonomuraea muscovyensis]
MRADDRRKATRKRNVTISLSLIGVFAAVLAVLFTVDALRPQSGTSAVAAGESRLVRSDSHRLQTAPDGKVTLVEFLDFECGGCRAYFPVVEELRKHYAGKITFVVRYFPLANHYNAARAARAVEAAARQDKFEAMYQRMYERQDEWARKRVPADEIFRRYAKDLGLDVTAWDKAYQDPATLARVEKDAADGEALGVQGTPTFFLNGTKIQPLSSDAFKAAIDAALAK